MVFRYNKKYPGLCGPPEPRRFCMPRIDYHVHTAFSPDCDTPMAAQVARAAELGLDELCFTDHLELGLKQWIGHETDFEACRRACEELRRSPGAPVLRFGAEAGISCTPEEFERLTAILRGSRFDFVIASAHVVGDTNPMEPDFFEGRSFPEACRAYLAALLEGLRKLDPALYSCVGHVDFPVKGRLRQGEPQAALLWEYAPDELDEIFRLAIGEGKCVEINTSPFPLLGGRRPELGWLRRYAELGGEYVTIGSDSHRTELLSCGFELAVELAREAGIRYIAVYEDMRPSMLPIESF